MSSVGTYTRRVDTLGVNIPDGWTRVRSGGCVGCYCGDQSIQNRLSYFTELRYNKLYCFHKLIFPVSVSYTKEWGEWQPWVICTGEYCGLGKRSRIRKELIIGQRETTPGPVDISFDPPKGILQNFMKQYCLLHD